MCLDDVSIVLVMHINILVATILVFQYKSLHIPFAACGAVKGWFGFLRLVCNCV